MDKRQTSYAPLILPIVLLLLPALYVGSYLAIDRPSNWGMQVDSKGTFVNGYRYFADVRLGERPALGHVAPTIFWPLEQIDRKVRQEAWNTRPRVSRRPVPRLKIHSANQYAGGMTRRQLPA